MGEIKNNYEIKLICGLLFNPHFFIKQCSYNLEKIVFNINKIILENFIKKLNFNLEIDLQSEIVKFDHTNYYNEEMGQEIFRYWISFSPIIFAEKIYKIKILTNEIEQKFFTDEFGNRKVNIDPGYIEGSKLVLFSTKNYSHRIYLDEGIFAEVTLLYKNKQFQTLPWTYPDYQLPQTVEFFTKVRENMLKENS